ncbi:MAG: hypothetical protein HQK52_10420 [Oligoflexia bacterium]|nr:hypothetical protein [Oligoflexia bacterium]
MCNYSANYLKRGRHLIVWVILVFATATIGLSTSVYALSVDLMTPDREFRWCSPWQENEWSSADGTPDIDAPENNNMRASILQKFNGDLFLAHGSDPSKGGVKRKAALRVANSEAVDEQQKADIRGTLQIIPKERATPRDLIVLSGGHGDEGALWAAKRRSDQALLFKNINSLGKKRQYKVVALEACHGGGILPELSGLIAPGGVAVGLVTVSKPHWIRALNSETLSNADPVQLVALHALQQASSTGIEDGLMAALNVMDNSHKSCAPRAIKRALSTLIRKQGAPTARADEASALQLIDNLVKHQECDREMKILYGGLSSKIKGERITDKDPRYAKGVRRAITVAEADENRVIAQRLLDACSAKAASCPRRCDGNYIRVLQQLAKPGAIQLASSKGQLIEYKEEEHLADLPSMHALRAYQDEIFALGEGLGLNAAIVYNPSDKKMHYPSWMDTALGLCGEAAPDKNFQEILSNIKKNYPKETQFIGTDSAGLMTAIESSFVVSPAESCNASASAPLEWSLPAPVKFKHEH